MNSQTTPKGWRGAVPDLRGPLASAPVAEPMPTRWISGGPRRDGNALSRAQVSLHDERRNGVFSGFHEERPDRWRSQRQSSQARAGWVGVVLRVLAVVCWLAAGLTLGRGGW
jgi:hypothetical protein